MLSENNSWFGLFGGVSLVSGSQVGSSAVAEDHQAGIVLHVQNINSLPLLNQGSS